jgi:hypothetical protein
MSITINYQKRKNAELFQSLEKLDMENVQNYVPIYQRFFSLNETNYNAINLNHTWHVTNVSSKIQNNLYQCTIKNTETNDTKTKQVFFKSAPLLDPFKYMVGKYNVLDSSLLNLPKLDSTAKTVHAKILDVNNSAYVDGLFSYLSSSLSNKNNFIHGLEFYGSYLAVKKSFTLNIFDDLDYLVKSDFFNKNKNVLFEVEDYSEKYWNEDDIIPQKLQPIKIADSDANILKDAEELQDSMFENVFAIEPDNTPTAETPSSFAELTLDNLREMNFTMDDIEDKNKTTTLKSGSTCSSRTSHTKSTDEIDGHKVNSGNDDNSGDNDDDNDENEDDDSGVWTNETSSNSNSNDSSESVNAVIPKFPVQVICMENCEMTLDDYIAENELEEVEWFSLLMQVVMTLITYQKAFAFTHNDLHTNNIMCVNTKKEFLYYCYKKKYYRVPTFGKIFKIIDFGRAIYKFDGKQFCSDSFQNGGDAFTQYNCEPYYNDKKPRLEPNYSFDLCRLACSIFDYLVEDMDSIKELDKCDAITRLIVEWCIDDNGVNILYKNNGADRYPDFKLYKMIARQVHHHTPQAQLERKEFGAFTINKNKIPSKEHVMNIDDIPSYI